LGGDVVGGDILENFGENPEKIFCKKIERGKIKKISDWQAGFFGEIYVRVYQSGK
jgi:hypothetical protein